MHSSRKIQGQAGFSLMELLVCLGIMSVVMGGAFILLGRSLNFANTTYHMTEAEQTMRTAHEVLNRDLTTAGDGLRGMNMIKLPVAFVQNFLTRTPLADPGTPNYPNLGLVTSDDSVPAYIAVPQSNPAATVRTGTDRLTMLTQDRSFTPVSLLPGRITYAGSNTSIVVPAGQIGLFTSGEIYAIASQNSLAFGVITAVNTGTATLTLTNGDVYGINQTGAGTPIFVVTEMNTTGRASTQSASIIRLQMIHYFVNNSNMLVRRVFGVKGAGFVDSVVAEHVTAIQHRYFLSTIDASGFVAQPVRQLTLANNTDVRQVETTITVETVRAVNNVNSANQGRQTMSTTQATTVRNLQFREAL